MNPPREITKFLIYHFSPEEMQALSAHLVRNTQDLETVQDRKKQVMADFTAKIKANEAEIFKAARLIGNGYEYRDVKCTVVFDEPRKAMKRIIRQDTGEVVAEEPMTADELQYVLDLDVEATAEEVKHDAPPDETKTPEPETEAPPETQQQPASETINDDDLPFDDAISGPQPEPVRITGKGDNWCAEIVILTTAAGFTAIPSFQFNSADPVGLNTPDVYLSESECREKAALAIWTAANRMDTGDGRAKRKALRAIMAWAQTQIQAAKGGASDVQ